MVTNMGRLRGLYMDVCVRRNEFAVCVAVDVKRTRAGYQFASHVVDKGGVLAHSVSVRWITSASVVWRDINEKSEWVSSSR
jgi:hypothetical protein